MHESFYSATLIEFVIFDNEREKVIVSYESFQDLPSNRHDELEKNSSEITFQGKKWIILEINRDLCQHGKGEYVKVRLGQPRTHAKM